MNNNIKINAIVAMTNYRVIGNGKEIPWHLPEDLKRFRKITIGKCLIMGRTTYESIGKPLPGRTSIVISRNEVKPFREKNTKVVWAKNPEEAIQIASKENFDEVFVVGGGQIYKHYLQLYNKLYVTYIYKNFPGDVYFPEFSLVGWKTVKIEKCSNDEFQYEYIDFKKI